MVCGTNWVLNPALQVHGHRAYWLKEAGLAWEYAPWCLVHSPVD